MAMRLACQTTAGAAGFAVSKRPRSGNGSRWRDGLHGGGGSAEGARAKSGDEEKREESFHREEEKA
jgi:hypothetical protein